MGPPVLRGLRLSTVLNLVIDPLLSEDAPESTSVTFQGWRVKRLTLRTPILDGDDVNRVPTPSQLCSTILRPHHFTVRLGRHKRFTFPDEPHQLPILLLAVPTQLGQGGTQPQHAHPRATSLPRRLVTPTRRIQSILVRVTNVQVGHGIRVHHRHLHDGSRPVTRPAP